jgi:hypothetical protein
MLLGALLDLGLGIDDLRGALGSLLPEGASLEAARVMRSGISATAFRVLEPADAHPHGHHHHRHLSAVNALIDRAAFSPGVKVRAKALYERLAGVEADIHQVPLDRVHLHEVGALDSVVDIVGTVWALDALGVDHVVASPLNVGGGRVQTEHGLLPVPAPATLRLLQGAPVYSDGTAFELVTPTGALLVTGHAASYGAMPPMTIRRAGYGAGSRDLPSHPNVLRAVLGVEEAQGSPDRVAVIECNIDDMNPQIFGVAMEQLYAQGALEVFYTAVVMKKGRPGTLATVIAPTDRLEAMLDVLFRETTTIGVRHRESARECLARETVTVNTEYGSVRVKVARRNGVEMNAAPEFEDCARLGRERHVPVRTVQAAAHRAYAGRLSHGGEAGGEEDGRQG